MNTTTNIPNPPRFIDPCDWPHIEAWMRTRPVHDWDTCVNRGIRWTYRITDDGLSSYFTVVDNADGSEFEVPDSDPSTW
jgi:hypothetical protein